VHDARAETDGMLGSGMARRTTATFDEFYASAWRRAAGWATALTGDVASGEEIAQHAFLALADRYDRLDDPMPYLRRTIVNGARTAHRSDARRVAREQRATIGGSTESPLDVDLLAALARLGTDQRSAVVLRYWADWTDAQIADALGCRASTVRSHLRRGLARLRADLGSDPEAPS
jgi:RNA polymerase sigma factor (sigma-70 family)